MEEEFAPQFSQYLSKSLNLFKINKSRPMFNCIEKLIHLILYLVTVHWTQAIRLPNGGLVQLVTSITRRCYGYKNNMFILEWSLLYIGTL